MTKPDEIRRLIEAFLADHGRFSDDDMRAHLVANGVPDAIAQLAVDDWARENDGYARPEDVETLIAHLGLPPDSGDLNVEAAERLADHATTMLGAYEDASNRLQAALAQLTAAMREHGAATVGDLPEHLAPVVDAHWDAVQAVRDAGRALDAIKLYGIPA